MWGGGRCVSLGGCWGSPWSLVFCVYVIEDICGFFVDLMERDVTLLSRCVSFELFGLGMLLWLWVWLRFG